MKGTNPIHHSVFFRLKHEQGSQDEESFLQIANALSSLPGVMDFRCLRQVGKMNNFNFGLLMTFADQAAYDAYNVHPDHIAFVEQIWLKEVEDFLEIDYQDMPT